VGRALAALTMIGSVTIGGCTGVLDGGPGLAGRAPGSPPGSGACSTAVRASPAGLVRLTPDQYVATVQDLVGAPELELRVTDAGPILTETGVRELRDAVEATVAARDAWSAEVVPCDTSGAVVPGCVDAFLDGFAARAYRRPLTADERSRLEATFEAASAELSFADAMDVLVQVVLMAPQVVYRQDIGVADPSLPASIRRLTDHEVAARLSYTLWGTTPDAALLARADARGLSSAADVQAEARRMIADPRSRRVLGRFVWTWLGLDGNELHRGLAETEKDPELYPQDSPALRAAMQTEIEALVAWVMEEEGGSLETLLTTRRAYVNGPLAELYGVPHGGGADDWRWVELPEGERAGLLTRAGFLGVHSGRRVSSPIRRGVVVLEEVACVALGAPPPDVNNVLPEGGEQLDESGRTVVRSVREDVHARTRGAECVGCHDTINPVGYAFEHYDALGVFRTTEALTGLPIDASGALGRTGDADGPVADAIELSERLAASDTTRRCVADRLLTRFYGSEASAELSECARDAARDAAIRTGRIEDVVLAIVGDDAFRLVEAGEDVAIEP
jgi:hypothetical protein